MRAIVTTILSLALFMFWGCSGDKDSVQVPVESAVPGPVSSYDPATATARIFGSIKFDGKAPEMAPLRPGGSLFCVRNARGIKSQEGLVTSDGKLQNVIVYVRTGHEGRSYSAPAESVLLDQQGCVYTPHVFTIMTNQKLTIRNSDDTFHNVHAQSRVNPAFNLAQPVKGAENTETFVRPEMPFRIGCDLHGWMGAYVGIFDHPFHTTSGATGDYELNLPPGKYEIVAWHEKYGEETMTVEVNAQQDAELTFTFAEKSSD